MFAQILLSTQSQERELKQALSDYNPWFQISMKKPPLILSPLQALPTWPLKYTSESAAHNLEEPALVNTPKSTLQNNSVSDRVIIVGTTKSANNNLQNDYSGKRIPFTDNTKSTIAKDIDPLHDKNSVESLFNEIKSIIAGNDTQNSEPIELLSDNSKNIEGLSQSNMGNEDNTSIGNLSRICKTSFAQSIENKETHFMSKSRQGSGMTEATKHIWKRLGYVPQTNNEINNSNASTNNLLEEMSKTFSKKLPPVSQYRIQSSTSVVNFPSTQSSFCLQSSEKNLNNDIIKMISDELCPGTSNTERSTKIRSKASNVYISDANNTKELDQQHISEDEVDREMEELLNHWANKHLDTNATAASNSKSSNASHMQHDKIEGLTDACFTKGAPDDVLQDKSGGLLEKLTKCNNSKDIMDTKLKMLQSKRNYIKFIMAERQKKLHGVANRIESSAFKNLLGHKFKLDSQNPENKSSKCSIDKQTDSIYPSNSRTTSLQANYAMNRNSNSSINENQPHVTENVSSVIISNVDVSKSNDNCCIKPSFRANDIPSLSEDRRSNIYSTCSRENVSERIPLSCVNTRLNKQVSKKDQTIRLISRETLKPAIQKSRSDLGLMKEVRFQFPPRMQAPIGLPSISTNSSIQVENSENKSALGVNSKSTTNTSKTNDGIPSYSSNYVRTIGKPMTSYKHSIRNKSDRILKSEFPIIRKRSVKQKKIFINYMTSSRIENGNLIDYSCRIITERKSTRPCNSSDLLFRYSGNRISNTNTILRSNNAKSNFEGSTNINENNILHVIRKPSNTILKQEACSENSSNSKLLVASLPSTDNSKTVRGEQLYKSQESIPNEINGNLTNISNLSNNQNKSLINCLSPNNKEIIRQKLSLQSKLSNEENQQLYHTQQQPTDLQAKSTTGKLKNIYHILNKFTLVITWNNNFEIPQTCNSFLYYF